MANSDAMQYLMQLLQQSPQLFGQLMDDLRRNQNPGALAEPAPQHNIPWAPFPNASKAEFTIDPSLANESTFGVYAPSDGSIRLMAHPGSKKIDPEIVPHEVGHKIWYEDLSPALKDWWKAVHVGSPDNSAINIHKDDPSHSFAVAFGHFTHNPGTLQKYSPEVYDYFKTITASSK